MPASQADVRAGEAFEEDVTSEALAEEEEGGFEVVAGTPVGHGGLPLFLVVCFVLIVIWAIFAWVNPAGK